MVAQPDELLFVKYIDVGGQQFDLAVGRHLKMDLQRQFALQAQRRSPRRTARPRGRPQRGRSDTAGARALTSELAMCVRYHSVTFRGQPIVRMVISGGEATQSLVESWEKTST